MNWLINTLTSSIGRKVVMALTGLFLCLFLIVHVGGNLQLFMNDGGYAFNTYANFLSHFPPIVVISYLLYFCILLHAFTALLITLRNQKARPVKYEKNQPSGNSAWNARNMGILGTVLLVFIVVHMANFWYEYKFQGDIPYTQYTIDQKTGEPIAEKTKHLSIQEYNAKTELQEYAINENERIVIIKDLYKEVSVTFKQNWWLDILYILGMIALAYHLIHGFWSAFQTLGIDNKKYVPAIRFLAVWIFGVLIPLCFALMPIYFWFK